MRTSQIVTPKSFYVQERDRLYSSWRTAFWRELGQNSADAGAKNIHIEIGHADGKGSFGRRASVDQVIRVKFSDDGHGMTPDVIDNVYFRPGESTKRDGNSIGGFGRARLLTCFSMVRYCIHTLNSFVEGDGPEYIHHSFQDMADLFGEHADQLQAEYDRSQDPELRARLRDLRGDQEVARELARKGRVKGCAIEIDINPNEYGPGNYRNPTLDNMMKELTNYLSMSQLPAKVFINGEEFKGQLLRGQARRDLTAELEDGSTVTFGTLHTNRSDKATHKQRMIVRVMGATMFDIPIRSDVQVILELDPAMARDVMTANRDGFRSPYSEVFDKLKSELAVDTKSALDGRKHEQVTIAGRLGRLKAKRPDQAISMAPAEGVLDSDSQVTGAMTLTKRPAIYEGSSSTAASQIQSFGYGGVPFHIWKSFLERVRSWDDTFVSDYGHNQLRNRLYDAIAGRGGVEMVRNAIESMTPEDLAFVLSTLHDRVSQADAVARAEFEKKLDGLPDIRVHTHGEIKGKLRDAMRRYDPRQWNPSAGRGQQPRSILAAWTVCCEVALQTLLKHHPKVVDDEGFEWAPGFIYSAPEREYRFGETQEASIREAEYLKTETGERFFLLNPVDSNGVLKFNPRKREDLQYMAVLAAHEIAHLASTWHDEEFASVLTSLAGRVDMTEISARTKAALTSIRDIYAAAKSRVQPMDTQEGVRPADRLRANVFPAATISASIVSAPENRGHGSIARDTYLQAIEFQQDGTTLVDGDLLSTMEHDILGEFTQDPMMTLGSTP